MSEDFKIALQAWRNTPRSDEFSRAFGFFGRHIRTTLPDVRDPPSSVPDSFAVARENTRVRGVDNAGGHVLPPLHVGDLVHVQHAQSKSWTIDGKVIRVRPGGRSYDVETAGGIFSRNRRFLRLAAGPVSDEYPEDAVPEFAGNDPVLPRRSARIANSRVTFANTIQVYF